MMKIDKRLREVAKQDGAPMYRIQIDWSCVPKGEYRSQKEFGIEGVTTAAEAKSLLLTALKMSR